MAEPNTVVPTRAISTDSSLVRPIGRLRKTRRSISRTMNEVPETGSIPVSPITRTAIAPSRNVVDRRTTAKTMAGSTGNPPTQKMMIIAKKAIPMKIGMWLRGHSYQPRSSMYSSPFSPEKALLMSPNMLTKVGVILSSP